MYLLGYDLGTSSVKVALVDAATGACVASDFYPKAEAPIKALNPGWAEQRPEDWVNYLKLATKSVLESTGVDPKDIKAIGFSYQMHGLVAIDREGKVLRDAIIWCDSRGVPYGEEAFAALGEEACMPRLLNKPGNFTATKLQWVRRIPHFGLSPGAFLLPGKAVARMYLDRKGLPCRYFFNQQRDLLKSRMQVRQQPVLRSPDIRFPYGPKLHRLFFAHRSAKSPVSYFSQNHS